jgi:hypothetical protein
MGRVINFINSICLPSLLPVMAAHSIAKSLLSYNLPEKRGEGREKKKGREESG